MTAGPQRGRAAVTDASRRRGRLRSLVATSRRTLQLVYRDPEHVSERITLLYVDRLAAPSRAWARAALADDPPADRGAVAANLCRRSAQISRIDGAIAGTPFLIALVPGYVGHLWQEGEMVLRVAALYGHDPGDPDVAAQFLVLRGIHPSDEAARAALAVVAATPVPERSSRRRPIRTWIEAVRRLGVFGGFLDPPDDDKVDPVRPSPLRTLARLAVAGILWILTWVFPVTFMLMMSWGCESHSRALAGRTLRFYAGDERVARRAVPQHRGWRSTAHAVALVLSVAIPIAFVALADRVRNSTGLSPLAVAGAVVAVSLVLAMAAVAREV